MKRTLFSCLFICANIAAAQPRLSLRIEGSDSAGIYLNEPLILRLVLTNPGADAANIWNKEVEEQLSLLKRELEQKQIDSQAYSAEEARFNSLRRPVTNVVIGSPDKPWTSYISVEVDRGDTDASEPITLKQLPVLLSSPQIEVDGSAYHMVNYGKAPDVMVRPGTYTITARYQSFYSNPVTVVVHDKQVPEHLMKSEAVLLKFGRYYFEEQNFMRAEGFARQAIDAYPKSVASVILLGDILFMTGRYSEAYTIYMNARNLINTFGKRSYEAPVYLDGMIEAARSKQ